MNADEQRQLAKRLDTALADAGIEVLRASVHAGNVVGWEPVPAHGIIGRWLQNGWRVEDVSTERPV